MTAPGTPQGQLPSRRRAALPLIIIFLFTILLICLGIELYTRHSIGNQVADSISAEVNKNCTDNPRDEQSCATVGVPVRTSFGSTPILFGLSSKTLPQINVRIGPLPPADLRVGTVVQFDAKDIDYSDSTNLHFGSAHATLAIPPQALHNIINDEMKRQGGALAGALTVTNVTYHPDSSTIGLQLNNGLADLTIAPKVRDGQFVFELTDASVVGFRHQALVQGLRSIILELSGKYLDLLPPGFTAESVTVHEKSIDVELNGTNFTSQDLAQAGQTQRSRR